jgi:three-Cys-motif partner protein
MTKQKFGGNWTEEKLLRVRKYLIAYTKIMHKREFRYAWIDAFAGTGYRTLPQSEEETALMFPELAEQDTQQFWQGSARIALEVEPRFTKYLFVEKDPERFAELLLLKEEYPDRASDIVLVNADCNAWLQDLCANRNWKHNRAVLFLDPFGMQVEWQTIAAIAETRAIDLWILFPLGVAVNRLLRRDGAINQSAKKRLDILFGTEEWFDAFYQPVTRPTLFGAELSLEKSADFGEIGRYFISRLETVFPHVAKNPLPLRNSRNVPLYLLCFAASNYTALKIARDILGK